MRPITREFAHPSSNSIPFLVVPARWRRMAHCALRRFSPGTLSPCHRPSNCLLSRFRTIRSQLLDVPIPTPMRGCFMTRHELRWDSCSSISSATPGRGASGNCLMRGCGLCVNSARKAVSEAVGSVWSPKNSRSGTKRGTNGTGRASCPAIGPKAGTWIVFCGQPQVVLWLQPNSGTCLRATSACSVSGVISMRRGPCG